MSPSACGCAGKRRHDGPTKHRSEDGDGIEKRKKVGMECPWSHGWHKWLLFAVQGQQQRSHLGNALQLREKKMSGGGQGVCLSSECGGPATRTHVHRETCFITFIMPSPTPAR